MYRPTFKTKKNGVPVLSKNDIEFIGENFIRDFCPKALTDPQPIDVEGFIEVYLGLKVDYQYLSSDGRYLGMMVFNDTDKVIIFDPEKRQADYLHADARTVLIDNTLLAENQEHRFRYTMGHEGGHDIFHSGFYAYNPNQISLFDSGENPPMVQCREMQLKGKPGNWTDAEWMEWQSNFFSSVILMPAKAVKALFKGEEGKVVSSTLAGFSMISRAVQAFNVSPVAAKYRLEQLGILKAGVVSDDISFLAYGGRLLFQE